MILIGFLEIGGVKLKLARLLWLCLVFPLPQLYHHEERLVVCQTLILGLAVWALAPVQATQTGASAQTANGSSPNI